MGEVSQRHMVSCAQISTDGAQYTLALEKTSQVTSHIENIRELKIPDLEKMYLITM